MFQLGWCRNGPQHLHHLLLEVVPGRPVSVLDGSQDLHDGQDADAPVVGGVLSDSSVDEVRLEGPADPASGVSRIELVEREPGDQARVMGCSTSGPES